VRQEIVIRRRHLARHLGIAPFVWIEEGVAAEVEGERQRCRHDEERQADVGARRRAGGGSIQEAAVVAETR
jgi:hypothetical protein